jgi:hypothetical protein
MGAAWLCLHIAEHWRYTLDDSFLRAHYALMEEAARFFADVCVERPDGTLTVSPSSSPENVYITPSGASGILSNCAAMADEMLKLGFNLVSGGTDNHLVLIDLRNIGVTGKDLEKRLDEVFITVNKNAVPFDTQSPFITSGIRVGTAAATTRGLKEDDFRVIAKLIWLAATDFENQADYIRAEVTKLTDKYPLY